MTDRWMLAANTERKCAEYMSKVIKYELNHDAKSKMKNAVKMVSASIQMKSTFFGPFLELCQSYWIVQTAVQIYTI